MNGGSVSLPGRVCVPIPTIRRVRYRNFLVSLKKNKLYENENHKKGGKKGAHIIYTPDFLRAMWRLESFKWYPRSKKNNEKKKRKGARNGNV